MWEAVRALEYRPNQVARNLRTQRTNVIGFLTDEVVKIWATRPDGAAQALPGDPGRAGADIYFAYDLPVDAPAGTWWMTAYGMRSERLLVVSFVVVR